ncbi:hypothetical protein ARMGADRAFT_312999 [Armillaria gallica]|uniref:Uncharacterized protein n=1 Tax=Armillaria gallica TaxID=47427 RepID=A0A2H3DFT6_ARMGA|nr:hypothetical protein ARMGADRAFT_312962 [Armillaria gallica]PBK90303.1 hypothetical protein ARMGADRAFT_312999 [Armillaria gallica]
MVFLHLATTTTMLVFHDHSRDRSSIADICLSPLIAEAATCLGQMHLARGRCPLPKRRYSSCPILVVTKGIQCYVTESMEATTRLVHAANRLSALLSIPMHPRYEHGGSNERIVAQSRKQKGGQASALWRSNTTSRRSRRRAKTPKGEGRTDGSHSFGAWRRAVQIHSALAAKYTLTSKFSATITYISSLGVNAAILNDGIGCSPGLKSSRTRLPTPRSRDG